MKSIQNTTEALFFQSPPCIYSHIQAILTEPQVYVSALQDKIDKGTISALSTAVKARVVAALHVTKQHKALDTMLPHCEATDLAKALSMLDAPREIRQEQRKIDKTEEANPHLKLHDSNTDERKVAPRRRCRRKTTEPRERIRKRKIDVHRRRLKELRAQQCDQHGDEAPCAAAHKDSATSEMMASASVSGSLARKVRQWARDNLTSDFLEFVMLAMPTDNWKKLADLVHFGPQDFKVDYFLGFVHGESLPEDCFVMAMRGLLKAPAHEVVDKFHIMAKKYPQTYLAYTFLRTEPRIVQQPQVAEALARHMPLSTAIWYLEELVAHSSNVQSIVAERIKTDDWLNVQSKVTTSYGKLLERILTFQSRGWALAEDLIPVAESRLSFLKEKFYAPNRGLTCVFGDASASMTAAIQAATILATMVSATLGGEVSFFSHQLIESPYKSPSSVDETLEICRKVNAGGATSLAAALWPYYQQRRAIERIVMVTDEEENTPCQGYLFAPLLKKYKEEVFVGVQLVLVSVGKGRSYFQSSLESNDIKYRRIEVDGYRPDLSKFDSLLGSMGVSLPLNETDTDVAVPDEEFVVL